MRRPANASLDGEGGVQWTGAALDEDHRSDHPHLSDDVRPPSCKAEDLADQACQRNLQRPGMPRLLKRREQRPAPVFDHVPATRGDMRKEALERLLRGAVEVRSVVDDEIERFGKLR